MLAARLRQSILAPIVLFGLSFSCWAADLSGCWSGSWESCSTGHRGPLSAEFVPCGGSQYDVHFRGRFLKIMPFHYSVTMTAEERNGVVYLSGSQYLGRMFGTFTFNAAATETEFNAIYSSCKDNGQFHLSRCGPACGPKP